MLRLALLGQGVRCALVVIGEVTSESARVLVETSDGAALDGADVAHLELSTGARGPAHAALTPAELARLRDQRPVALVPPGELCRVRRCSGSEHPETWSATRSGSYRLVIGGRAEMPAQKWSTAPGVYSVCSGSSRVQR